MYLPVGAQLGKRWLGTVVDLLLFTLQTNNLKNLLIKRGYHIFSQIFSQTYWLNLDTIFLAFAFFFGLSILSNKNKVVVYF